MTSSVPLLQTNAAKARSPATLATPIERSPDVPCGVIGGGSVANALVARVVKAINAIAEIAINFVASLSANWQDSV